MDRYSSLDQVCIINIPGLTTKEKHMPEEKNIIVKSKVSKGV